MNENYWEALKSGIITPEFYSKLLILESQQKIKDAQVLNNHLHYVDSYKLKKIDTKGFEGKIRIHKKG